MKRILIIEDERLSASRLKRLIEDIDDTLDISGPLTTVNEVIDMLSHDNGFDLVISDIRLHERLVFEAFHEVMPRAMVVFTTAYDEYALEAFRHNGIDYLLKPIEAGELAKAISKAKRLDNTQTDIECMSEGISSTARELNCYRERILVCRGDELIPLRVEDIRYFSMENNSVVAYTRQGDSHRIPITMNELEQQLNPNMFFRLNRQYIAHIDSIRKIGLYFSSKLIVHLVGCDDDHVVVSKEKSAQFKQWLNR